MLVNNEDKSIEGEDKSKKTTSVAIPLVETKPITPETKVEENKVQLSTESKNQIGHEEEEKCNKDEVADILNKDENVQDNNNDISSNIKNDTNVHLVDKTNDVIRQTELEHKQLVFDFGRYEGEVNTLTGKREGKGILHYNNGNVYDGQWRDGAPNGLGEKRYANGDVYRGGWMSGMRSGHGGYLYAAGHFFEGMYSNDEANGYGVLNTVNGDRYAGQWRRGKKEGKGRETLENGQVFIGYWRNGMKQGRGKLLISGALEYIYGIWNCDHFFRELTKSEMNQEAEEDIVDQYGLPRTVATSHNQRNSNLTASLENNNAPTPETSKPEGSWFDNLTETVSQTVLAGVNALEDRLAALGGALERVTDGTYTSFESPIEGQMMSFNQIADNDEADKSNMAKSKGANYALAEGNAGEAISSLGMLGARNVEMGRIIIDSDDTSTSTMSSSDSGKDNVEDKAKRRDN